MQNSIRERVPFCKKERQFIHKAKKKSGTQIECRRGVVLLRLYRGAEVGQGIGNPVDHGRDIGFAVFAEPFAGKPVRSVGPEKGNGMDGLRFQGKMPSPEIFRCQFKNGVQNR